MFENRWFCVLRLTALLMAASLACAPLSLAQDAQTPDVEAPAEDVEAPAEDVEAPAEDDAAETAEEPTEEAAPPAEEATPEAAPEAEPVVAPELLKAEDEMGEAIGAVRNEKPSDDKTSLSVRAGAVLNTGNTMNLQGNGGGDFEVIRGMNHVGASFSFAIGVSDLDPQDGDTDYEKTAANLNMDARYDRYLSEMDAAFGGMAFRRDIFAGLDARIQARTGYLRNFAKRNDHRFWGEGGYDFTFDDRYPNPLVDSDGLPELEQDGTPADQYESVHAARLFIGYDSVVNENVNLKMGLEGLFNLQQGEDVRLNGSFSLGTKVMDQLTLEVQFLSQFDNVPVPGRKKLDTLTQLNLIYRLI